MTRKDRLKFTTTTTKEQLAIQASFALGRLPRDENGQLNEDLSYRNLKNQSEQGWKGPDRMTLSWRSEVTRDYNDRARNAIVPEQVDLVNIDAPSVARERALKPYEKDLVGLIREATLDYSRFQCNDTSWDFAYRLMPGRVRVEYDNLTKMINEAKSKKAHLRWTQEDKKARAAVESQIKTLYSQRNPIKKYWLKRVNSALPALDRAGLIIYYPPTASRPAVFKGPEIQRPMTLQIVIPDHLAMACPSNPDWRKNLRQEVAISDQLLEDDQVTPNEGASIHQLDPIETQVMLVYKTWLEGTGDTLPVKPDESTKQKIKQALDRFPLQDILDAALGWRNVAYNNGTGDNPSPINQLTILLKNDSNVKRFRDAHRRPAEKTGAARNIGVFTEASSSRESL